MTYDNNIPEFALRPARDPEGEFDPTPYDRLLYGDENDNTVCEIEPVEEKKPVKIVPLGEISRYDKTSIRDMEEKPPAKVFIEADIIVPDSQPDLMKVISMSGKIRTEKRHIEGGTSGIEKISCAGEIDIETLYIPEKPEKDRPLILIKNTVPFDNRWNEALEAGTEALIYPHIEKIEYTVLNERKLRIRVSAAADVKKYRNVSFQTLRKVEGEKIEMLKEQVSFMDIIQRRQDSMEIEDAFEIKDGNIRPVEILKSSIMVSPVSSQISGSKAVIGGNVCCSIMYLAETSEEGEKKIVPAYFRGETDFTQFVSLDKGDEASESRILFTDHSLKIDISDEEDKPVFRLKGSVVTEVQLYSQFEKSVVKDIYHNEKDIKYDTSQVHVKSYAGTSGKEFSIKGTVTINNETIDEPLFAEGNISGAAAAGNNDLVQISGKTDVKVIALSETGEFISGSAEIPFEIPVEIKKMKNFTPAKAEVKVKDISFEKTGDKEIEVTLYLTASAFTEKTEEITVLNNLCYIKDEKKNRQPPMVLYLAGADDTLWSIAKKFRTSEENIREINGIDKEVKEGERILVVR